MLADLETRDAAAAFFDDADALMAQDAAGGDARNVAFQDVKVGAADRGGDDAHNGVGRFQNPWPRFLLQRSRAGPKVNQRPHRRSLLLRLRRSRRAR